MVKNMTVNIDEETLQDIINIETKLLFPLQGFMGAEDFYSVVNHYILENGQVFTIPVTLDVPVEIYKNIKARDRLMLKYKEKSVAQMDVESRFEITEDDLEKIFQTKENSHPGVQKEKNRSPYRVGGPVRLIEKAYLKDALCPEETKYIFKKKGWKTIVGFQTRNPIHKAHEHIQRIGLEVCDGLFINPITGWKKQGDFTQEAVMAAYNKMTEEFYPENRVYIAGLKTQMRYAGPREAIFHAIIRRNLGCTHFIIGRDHAGVGGYYGAYDAHALANKLTEKYDLGIHLLLTREPYYCKKCEQIVTDKHCAHYGSDRIEISGTIIRKYIKDGYIPDEIMMRKEIFKSILNCKQVFIE